MISQQGEKPSFHRVSEYYAENHETILYRPKNKIQSLEIRKFATKLGCNRDASNHLVLDPALVGATEDFEESTVAPRRGPRIRNKPIWSAVFSSIADHLNAVSTKVATGGMLIDSCLVMEKVLVNRETCLNRSIGGYLSHDIVDTRTNAICALCVVARPRLAVSARFTPLARWSRDEVKARLLIGCARRNGIRIATIRYQAMILNPLPCVTWFATLTSVIRSTADKVFKRQHFVE